MAILQLAVVEGLGAVGGDDQDRLGDGLEIGAEMDRALEGEDLLRRRLDAEMSEHGLVGGLLLAARNEDANAADGKPRHGAELHAIAGIEGARGVETAIAQPPDAKAPRHRPMA